MYVCLYIFVYIYHSIQRFELSMADKIADIVNSVNAINTKVTEKTSEHHFIPKYTYLPIYLPIKTF